MEHSTINSVKKVGAAMLIMASLPAIAAPINYLYQGTASGSLDGQSFDSVGFTITAFADTDNIQPWDPANLQNTHISATINVDGFGSYDFEEATHTWIADGFGGGFGLDLSFNIITINANALANSGYNLGTDFGPVFEDSPNIIFPFAGVLTTGGLLSFTDMNDVTFSASLTQVPVPGAIWLFGTALVGLFGGTRRRHRL